jgi:hypothetical protein
MTTVAEISVAVKQLPRRELARFRRWFAEYDAAQWDREFEADVAAGKLDKIAREVLRDHRAGRTTPR